jgi:hypothetical protein
LPLIAGLPDLQSQARARNRDELRPVIPR